MISVLVASFIACLCPAIADEKPTIDELFCWYPSGKYSFLIHTDLERAKAGKGWEISEPVRIAASEREIYDPMSWLPDSLKDSCTFYTKAEPLRMKIVKSEFATTEPDSQPRPFQSRRAHLCAYRFDSSPDMVKSALETGGISGTGVNHMGLRVSSYWGKNCVGDRAEMFAAEYGRLLEERRTVEVVGSLRIITTVFDDKLIEAKVKHGRAQYERWKEQQEEKK